jgi:hypothetical protein
MAQRNKSTFEKKRREMEQKKRRAEKLERKAERDAAGPSTESVNDDPWANQGSVEDSPRGR